MAKSPPNEVILLSQVSYLVEALIFVAFARFFLNPLIFHFFVLFCLRFLTIWVTSCFFKVFSGTYLTGVPNGFLTVFYFLVQNSGINKRFARRPKETNQRLCKCFMNKGERKESRKQLQLLSI
jgi:hypothetical protein